MYFVHHKFTIFGITTFITKTAKPTLAWSLVPTNHNHHHHHHHHHHPRAKPSSYQGWMSCIAIVCGPTTFTYMLKCKPKPRGFKGNILCMSQVLDLSWTWSVPFRRQNNPTSNNMAWSVPFRRENSLTR